jgi:hypothetical protein
VNDYNTNEETPVVCGVRGTLQSQKTLNRTIEAARRAIDEPVFNN